MQRYVSLLKMQIFKQNIDIILMLI